MANDLSNATHQTVFSGSLDEVQDFFYGRQWTDGLPIIPPTPDRVDRFLAFSDRSGKEVIGELPPEQGAASVWSIAVNGVMAGCRPEYMPLLIAVVEAIAEPGFHLEDGGSTPGWDPLIIVNGPVVEMLGFNCGTGVMKLGNRANSTIGRFLSLYMLNVAGLRPPPGQTNKGSIGGSFNVVLPESNAVLDEIGWQSFSEEMGYARDDNVVTVQSSVASSPPIYSSGDRGLDHLDVIAKVFGLGTCANPLWFINPRQAQFTPALILTPLIAKVLARDGYSKRDVARYLHEVAKIPLGMVEMFHESLGVRGGGLLAGEGRSVTNFCESLGLSRADLQPPIDRERLVPVFPWPETIGLVVAGDPGRNQSRGYVSNHRQGARTSKLIQIPGNWQEAVEAMQGRK